MQGPSTRLESGFVYDNQGHIVTNNHVVNSAKTMDVTFVDGNTYTAKVIGTDPSSDLAVLQIIGNFSVEEVIRLIIASSSRVQVKQPVTAISNPFGLSDTMMNGIVTHGTFAAEPRSPIWYTKRTDAAINPGNSGGPLLNMQGHAIGMNTAISSSTGEFSELLYSMITATNTLP